MNPIIEFRDVTFTYPGQGDNKKRVLYSLNLLIYPGEMVAIVGSNGSGKTTLLRHMNGLLLPQSGKVIIDGLDTRSKENLGLVRQRVGMVFQFPEDQIVATTVAEDVAFGPENLGLHSIEIRKRVAEALAMVGLRRPCEPRAAHAFGWANTTPGFGWSSGDAAKGGVV